MLSGERATRGPRRRGDGRWLDSFVAAWVVASVCSCGGTSVSSPPFTDSSDAADGPNYDLGASDGGVQPLSVAITTSAGDAAPATFASCEGGCIDVVAVGSGGRPPYLYAWSDGATGATRQLCTTASKAITVTVTDTPVALGDNPPAPRKATATLALQVPACSDAGAAVTHDGGTDAAGLVPSTPGCGTASSSPSCRPGGPGMTTCGASGDDCCCASLEVTGGTYYRTFTNTGFLPTGEADPATVSGFRLDKYPVTVGRFRQFVSAWNGGSGFAPPAGSGLHVHLNGGRGLASGPSVASGQTYESGWVASDDADIVPTDANLECDAKYPDWTSSPGSGEDLPVTCVTWYEAYAFCIWDGGFLPSEAEWEYAAVGGSNQSEYPWGSAAPGVSNAYAIFDCQYPLGGCTVAPVGLASMGAGTWGQLDLAGNVFEWVLDAYVPPYDDPCTDCAHVAPAGGVVRGSSFQTATTTGLRSAARYYADTGQRDSGIGLRCAHVP